MTDADLARLVSDRAVLGAWPTPTGNIATAVYEAGGVTRELGGGRVSARSYCERWGSTEGPVFGACESRRRGHRS